MGSMIPDYSEPRFANYTRPVYLARKVLSEAGISSFPVSFRLVLRHNGIRLLKYGECCRANDMTLPDCISLFGRDGAAIFQQGRFVIVYNENIVPEERIRFTLAHELGHIFLGHHAEVNMGILSRAWVQKSLYDILEDEANCFARNLLCPPLETVSLLRLHGFTATLFDESRKRNAWIRVKDAPSCPGVPDDLRDSALLRQAFLITEKAAGIRCHFLKQDLSNLRPADRDTPLRIGFTAAWRCLACGAPRMDDSPYCYHCGRKNRFGFSVWEDAPAPPVLRLSGDKKAASDGPPDPFAMNRDLRLSRCCYCGRAKHDKDALFCVTCGRPVVNFCTGCSRRYGSRVRFCGQCGKPTVFLKKEILLPGDALPAAFTGYHEPPAPPEGPYTLRKRREEEEKKRGAEREKRLEELMKHYV